MKKLALAFLIGCSMLLAGCPASMQTNSDGSTTKLAPAAQYITDSKRAVDVLNAAEILVTKAIQANVLKGQDADTTILAIKAGKDGLHAADDMAKTDPTGGSAKVAWTLGIFSATQVYLATKGVK